MYNMPEFNQINKEDTMSQGTKGSTKLMIAVWAIVMMFIGFKAFNASSDDSASNDLQVDSATIERIKQIAPIWKHEFFVGGDVWIEGATAHPEDEVARQDALKRSCA